MNIRTTCQILIGIALFALPGIALAQIDSIPRIVAANPETGFPDTRVTLVGTGFGTTINQTVVTVGKKTAKIVYLKNDSLAFMVPLSASEGKTSIRVIRGEDSSTSHPFEINSFNLIKTLRNTLGGIVFLLFGIFILSEGLKKYSRQKSSAILRMLPRSKPLAFMKGFVLALLTQSSTIAAVTLMGFVTAGFIPLVQSMFVLLGANLGSSAIALFLQFDIAKHGLWVLIVGIGLMLFGRLQKRSWYFSEVIMGIGFVLYGMQLVMNGFSPLASHSVTTDFFGMFTTSTVPGFVLCLLIGIVVSIMLQSTSALVVFLLGIAKATNFVDFPTCMAIIIGGNIGVIATTLVASRFEPPAGKAFAKNHALLVLCGAILSVALFFPMIRLIDLIVPFDPAAAAVGKKIVQPFIGAHIALGFLAVNLISTLPLLPFVAFICKATSRNQPHSDSTVQIALELIEGSVEASTVAASGELQQMLHDTQKALQHLDSILINHEYDRFEQLTQLRQNIVKRGNSVVLHLSRFSVDNKEYYWSRQIEKLTYAATELARIPTHMVAMVDHFAKDRDNKYHFDAGTEAAVKEFSERLINFSGLVSHVIDDPMSYDITEIRYSEILINRTEETSRNLLIKEISRGGYTIDIGQRLINLMSSYEQIGNYLYRVADFLLMKHEM